MPTMRIPYGVLDGRYVNAAGDDMSGQLDILNSVAQLRLAFERDVKFADFTVDTNHDLTIKPSSTGQVIVQPTTDSTDFFQILDADGGIPVLNVDATNERVGIGTATPSQKLEVDGNIQISNGNQLIVTRGLGTNRDISFYSSSIYDNIGALTIYPSSGTNVKAGIDVSPRGTGYSSINKAEIAIYNTDFVANSSIFEVLRIRTMGSSYRIFSENTGGGTSLRPIRISASGWSSDQFILATSGNVGINTEGPDRKLDVLDASAPQVRLTHTDGSVYTEFQADGSGYLTITPTGLIVKVAASIYPAANDTYYLGKNDDDTPFAWKGIIVKDTTDGKYYRIECINGVVTATDLTD